MKKKNFNKKILIIPIILIILIFLFEITGFYMKSFSSAIPQTRRDYRPEHCIENKCMDTVIFSQLPLYPKDFSKDLNADENYWKQPEFYPGFENNIHYYINPPPAYLGMFGYGAYPADKKLNVKPEDYLEEIIYFHSSWYVYNCQAIKLDFVMDNSIKNYFDVSVEPNEILLEPTFPLFDYNWTQKVKLIIKVKNPPKGIYSIGIDVSEPSNELRQLGLKRCGKRYSSGGMFGIGRPFYQLKLTIV